MITLTTGQIEAWLGEVIWPFVRVAACLMVAPPFGTETVPPRVRIVLAGAIALTIAPLVPAPAGIAVFSGAGLVVTVQQILIGVALGFALQMVFDAVAMGGQLLANSMGLSFAFNVDPLHGAATAALGQLYSVLVTLTFIALDGHLRLIELLVDGFRNLPIGTGGLSGGALWQLVGWGSQVFGGALAVALPGVTALLIVNLSFGMVSRAAPTLNLFAVGFPISLVFGLAIVLAGLPTLQASFVHLLQSTFLMLQSLTGAGG